MPTMVALYSGPDVSSAKLVAVSSDRALVGHVANELLRDERYQVPNGGDPVIAAVNDGRRRALTLVAEAAGD